MPACLNAPLAGSSDQRDRISINFFFSPQTKGHLGTLKSLKNLSTIRRLLLVIQTHIRVAFKIQSTHRFDRVEVNQKAYKSNRKSHSLYIHVYSRLDGNLVQDEIILAVCCESQLVILILGFLAKDSSSSLGLEPRNHQVSIADRLQITCDRTRRDLKWTVSLDKFTQRGDGPELPHLSLLHVQAS